MKQSYSPLKAAFFILLVALSAPLTTHAQTYAWAAGMRGTGDDQSRSIAVDGSGNVYTTGNFRGTVDFDPGAGTAELTSSGNNFDIFISKLDASGNYVWAKRMGGTFSDVSYGIAVDGSGNVYTTGYFRGTVDFDPGVGTVNLRSRMESDDIFISKLDASGNYVWAKSMQDGTSGDTGFAITVDGSGNVYTTGYFQGTVDFDPGVGTAELTAANLQDIFVSKLNASGDYVWAKSMGGNLDDSGRAIAVDGSGNVYTTGTFRGTIGDYDPGAGTANLASAGESDIFISKLDASGNYVWAKSLAGTSEEYGYGIAVDGSGNVYTTGYFLSTVDFDPSAGTANLTSAGGRDIFISKLDASGNYVWAKSMGGTATADSFAGGDIGYGIAVDGSGNVYTTGQFDIEADFDPGAGTVNLTSVGLVDIFISKLDASGNYVWAKSMGGTANDLGYDIAVDGSGNVYTTGFFRGTVDFDPGPGTAELTARAGSDIFVSKITSCNCDPSCSPIPTAAGTYTAATSRTDAATSVTHYCDASGNLLLSTKTVAVGSTTTIPPAAVQVKVGATAATFYPKWCGGTTAADKCFMVKAPATGGNVLINRWWHIDAAQVTGTAVSGSNQLQISTYFTDTEYTALQTQMTTNSVIPALTSQTGLVLYQPFASPVLAKFADPALVKPLIFTKVSNGAQVGINLWQHSTQTGGVNQATFKISSIVNSGGIGKF